MARVKQRTVQIEEGKWYHLGHFENSECCDCGLVHREEFKLEAGRIWFRTFRNEPATRRARARRAAAGPLSQSK
jgi:hypothetical protein